MKSVFLYGFVALAMSCPQALASNPQSSPAETDVKVKAKAGRSIARDKSKPVRKAIGEWYARNVEAFNAKNVAAIMALRADDFHTVTPDGRANTRADMEARTRQFLNRIDHFISQDNEIGTIEVNGDLASAYVTQRTVRMQRLPDGALHKVEAGAISVSVFGLPP